MKQRLLCLTLKVLTLSIGQQAFAYDFEVNGIYYNLDSYYLTAIVTSGENPYKGTVIIPDSVTYKGKTMAVKLVGKSAFINCVDLTSIQFGKCVSTIDDNAFKGCTNLTRLTIPQTISRIENGAFLDCNKLKELTFEDSDSPLRFGTNGEYAPSSAFNCKPEYLYMGRALGKPEWDRGYNLDNSELRTLIIGNQITSVSGFSGAQITKLSIPASVVSIGKAAFTNCTKLETVIFEDGVNIIRCYEAYYRPGDNGNYYNWSAFCDCPLKYVYIGRPMTVTDNSNALAWPINGTPVEKVTISESLTSLCGIFSCPNLKEIDIPASVEEITGFNGCSSLTTIKCRAINPPNMRKYYSDPFDNNTYLNGILYVPETSINNYKSHKEWGKFFDIQKLNDSPISKQKCESPTISYENKKISFNCNTPNVIYHHTITSPDIVSGVNDGNIQLAALYRISVYASRADFENSDETIAFLYWANANLESTEIQNTTANSRGLLIQQNDGFLTISGLDNNESVGMYTIEGVQIGRNKAIFGSATFSINRSDKVVIIKIGNESIKVPIY